MTCMIIAVAFPFFFKQQVELGHQLQSQLAGLREEHQTTLLCLKEAHTLIERHVESSAQLSASEVRGWESDSSKCWIFLQNMCRLTVKYELILGGYPAGGVARGS